MMGYGRELAQQLTILDREPKLATLKTTADSLEPVLALLVHHVEGTAAAAAAAVESSEPVPSHPYRPRSRGARGSAATLPRAAHDGTRRPEPN